jgi:glycosyltransferase involved in cell wall biosynthesis
VNPIPTVVHLVISLAHGGLERLVVDWTNARNRRYPGSTTVRCLDAPGDMAGQVRGSAVVCLNAERSRFPWDRRAVQRLTAEIRERRAVVLHSHNLAAQQYAVLAAMGTSMRHVNTRHGTDVQFLRFRDRLRSRLLTAFTDRMVAVSEATAEAMRRYEGIPRSRIRVVPNGIALPPSSPAAEMTTLRTRLGIPADAVVIGSVGRLAAVKGYDRLLRAVARWDAGGGSPGRRESRGPAESEMVVLLVGDGPERASLEALAAQMGIADRVVFAGFQPEARQFYPLMDLFVLPSRSEGLPVAMLEAMAAEVPVMATAVGEVPAILGDGAFGALLPADEALWPEAIRRQLAPPGLQTARERARGAAARVHEAYSLEHTLDAYESLYQALAPCSTASGTE